MVPISQTKQIGYAVLVCPLCGSADYKLTDEQVKQGNGCAWIAFFVIMGVYILFRFIL
jgi:hypothetical protein